MNYNYNKNSHNNHSDQDNDSDYAPYSRQKKQTRQPRSNMNYKKRKNREFDDNQSIHSNHSKSNQRHSQPTIMSITDKRDYQQHPPKKKARVNKRSSKKPTIQTDSEPNSHVTVTFANINGTIDAIILPKQNVLAMTSDVLLENKGKLSIKTSDPIQNDITPQIPIDIKILTTPNIKTIHPRNSFRMGTSLFYCSVCFIFTFFTYSLNKNRSTFFIFTHNSFDINMNFTLRKKRKIYFRGNIPIIFLYFLFLISLHLIY